MRIKIKKELSKCLGDSQKWLSFFCRIKKIVSQTVVYKKTEVKLANKILKKYA